jgi:signal transduction histidine kinase/ligand-binding sensor domain-containing protein/FixJ family two-component response regulator
VSRAIKITLSVWMILLLNFSCGILLSQGALTFVKYSNQQGFNQNTIFAIEQDRDGFYWIGTVNGLIRYDGYDFVNITSGYNYRPDIPQERIKHLLTDRRGILWIVSQNSLHAYLTHKEQFFDVFTGPNVHFNKVFDFEADMLWIIGENFLGNVSTELLSDTIIFKSSENLLPTGFGPVNITDLIKIDDSMFLAGTDRGLFCLSREEDNRYSFEEITTGNSTFNITRILVRYDKNNILWIGTRNGLYKGIIDNRTMHILEEYRNLPNQPGSISDNSVLDIALGKENDLWIGTENGGLSRYNSDSDSFTNFRYNPHNPEGISSSQVNCIYVDDFNVVWLGTAQGGLSKLDLNQKRFINLRHNPFDNTTIPGDLINYIYEDSGGHLWISSYRKPVFRSNKPVSKDEVSAMTFKQYEKLAESLPGRDVLSIYEDNRSNFWFGGENNLSIYNKEQDSYLKLNITYKGEEINLRNVRNIKSYGESKIIIAGSAVVVLDDPWSKISRKQESLPAFSVHTMPETPDYRNGIESMLVDSKSRIWLGTRSNGLSVMQLEGDRLNLLHEFKYNKERNSGLNHNSIFTLHEENEHTFWIGTFGGGINKLTLASDLTQAVFEYIETSDGLPDNAVYGIIPENDSILWASTDMGLCRLNSLTGKITSYNINDGVSSNNYRRNAYHKGQSGYFYFGGLNGLTFFNPDDINPNTIPPRIVLANLEINNHRIKAGESFLGRTDISGPLSELTALKLTHKENSVAFEVLVQHSATPVNNSLAILLEGFDSDWIRISEGKFKQVYTNLPSGKYLLNVKGYNGEGLVSTNEISLPITILSPWYKRWWSYSLFSLILLAIGVGVSWYFILYERLGQKLNYEQKDKRRIEQVNQAKLQFFTSISHEFRTPLSLISATFQLFDRSNLSADQKKQISLIDKNTNRLINLIDQLLTFRKSEQGHLKLKYGKYTFGSFMYPIAEAFEDYSVRKGINFIHSIKSPQTKVILDNEKMERVLFNIISNAFKFTPVNGTIKFEGSIENTKGREFVRFDITDNGKGIPREEVKKIFKRFYQLNSEISHVGTGIGLSLSKSIVELHKGYIEVESEPGIQTRFTVFIPNDTSIDYVEDKIDMQKNRIKEFLSIEAIDASKLAEIKNDEAQQTILIVDDEQEFREIMRNVFQKSYKLIEAVNGKEALDLIKSENPDLVISDLMMPEMDGYELCKKVKSDIQICHIPVILLTALGEEEMQIRGYEYGADSYIAKPFNVKYLLVTVRKMIENRKKIKDHFSRSHTLPLDVNMSDIDQKFIESVNNIIEKNLDDSGFGVERLAKEMFLSTSQFYRKLKLLTGQVPNAYIRNYRLEKAAELIAGNPGVSMKTVMFEIGIESASYFTHAFKKKFDVLPSEYIAHQYAQNG